VPLGLVVTVGQGEIPAHLQPNVESTGWFKLGFALGRVLLAGVLIGGLYWVFIGRKRGGGTERTGSVNPASRHPRA
jgi:hypothetical protein